MEDFPNRMDDPAYAERKAALIAEITAAFDGVSRGVGVTLHEAMALDNYGNPAERAEARAQDTETRWQDVPDDDIRCSDAVLNFLDPTGFHYYLPAFLVWYLRSMDSHGPESESNNFDAVDYMLRAGYEAKIHDHYSSKFEVLTRAQAQAVAHFLVFQAEVGDADYAEDETWRLAEVARGAVTQEEYEAQNARSRKVYGESGRPESMARCALDRYWGQFL